MIVIYLCIFLVCLSVRAEEDTLEIVHVLFRHGEKNPDTKYTYPKDPYKNVTYKTFQQGQLKKIGRRTMYNLGRALRKRYDNYLGKIYSETVVEAWASPIGRALLSLQLVAASLFPPSEQERWNKELDWQPTIFHSADWQDDTLFLSMKQLGYLEEYNKVCASHEIQSMMRNYSELVQYLREHSGLGFHCTRHAYMLYLLLEAEQEANWTLPHWTHRIYPKPLKKFSLLEYKVQTYTPRLKWLLMGNLFVKILSDTENRIKLNSTKKFYLYSGHEINVYHTLDLLGFGTEKPYYPKYGACVIIEIHKINDRHILKVFYKRSKYDGFKLLNNRQGKNHITYDEFKNIVREIYENGNSSNSLAANNVKTYVILAALILCKLKWLY